MKTSDVNVNMVVTMVERMIFPHKFPLTFRKSYESHWNPNIAEADEHKITHNPAAHKPL